MTALYLFVVLPFFQIQLPFGPARITKDENHILGQVTRCHGAQRVDGSGDR